MNEMIILTAFPLWLFLWFFWPILAHWLQELFAKNVFLDILLFKLDLGQISFNPVENALPTQQLAFLATSIVFYHIVTRACAEIKIFDQKVTYVFRLFRLLDFFHLFSPFLFAAVIVELFAKKAFFFLLQWFSFYWACLRLKNFWVFHSTFWAFLCISKAPFGRSLWSGHHWEDLFLQQKCLWVRKKIELKIFNPLIRGAFCKKAFFWTFWWFSGWISAKLAIICPKIRLQHDSTPFLPLVSHFVTLWLGHVHILGSIWLTTLIWASLERSFPPAEMPILVKSDDVRSGRKAKVHHGRLQAAQGSMG